MNEKEFITLAISTVDKECLPTFGQTFLDSLTMSHHIEKHKSKAVKRKEKRQKTRAILKRYRDECNKELEKTTPLTVLAETESVASYSRKRIRQYFNPPSKSKKIKITHAPDFKTVQWNKEQVVADLKEAESHMQKIVWTQFADKHGIPGENRGQVAKEFATKNRTALCTEISRRCTFYKKTFFRYKYSNSNATNTKGSEG